ncbi:HNH endonuclease [Spirulina sp. 06S082]|uniref:HNH endonuclease n=1 Tax=Spirulina sp. 06S082 TaxID=3110248 RepID=UPI002B2116CE|nr:HNH endonuclease [Spirulina sp. 06S082]MEA5467711.1 HNH endonuclease [Spirulina sp. 06S082]
MRPILKGERPLDSEGNSKVFKQYQDARGDLIDRLGQYCSYCEMKIPTALAVEHIQPKKIYPELELEWNNFLLACPNCNSTKKDKDISLEDCYWPHIDNTFRAFLYLKGGLIHLNPILTQEEQQKARTTIELVGLQKESKSDKTRSDRRLSNRRETWDIAERSLRNLQANNTLGMRELIVSTMETSGFWSVWMTVFKDDPDMLNRFIAAFPGTCQECFDSLGKPVPRPRGRL